MTQKRIIIGITSIFVLALLVLFIIRPLTYAVIKRWPSTSLLNQRLSEAVEILGDKVPESALRHFAERGNAVDVMPDYEGPVIATTSKPVSINIAKISSISGLWRGEESGLFSDNLLATVKPAKTKDWSFSLSGSVESALIEVEIEFEEIEDQLLYQNLDAEIFMRLVYPNSTGMASFKNKKVDLATDVVFFFVTNEEFDKIDSIFFQSDMLELSILLILLVVILMGTILLILFRINNPDTWWW